MCIMLQLCVVFLWYVGCKYTNPNGKNASAMNKFLKKHEAHLIFQRFTIG
jgi:hypothetical protein